MSCPTCGRPGMDWGAEHASWCDDVRRQHHDDDVRARVGGDARGIRDFARWGWLTAGTEGRKAGGNGG